MGNPDWSTENLNPDTERGLNTSGAGHLKPLTLLVSQRVVAGAGRAGMAASQLPKRETFASQSPCPRRSPH